MPLCKHLLFPTPASGNHWSIFCVCIFAFGSLASFTYYSAFEIQPYCYQVSGVCSFLLLSVVPLCSVPQIICPFHSWEIFGEFPAFSNCIWKESSMTILCTVFLVCEFRFLVHLNKYLGWLLCSVSFFLFVCFWLSFFNFSHSSKCWWFITVYHLHFPLMTDDLSIFSYVYLLPYYFFWKCLSRSLALLLFGC